MSGIFHDLLDQPARPSGSRTVAYPNDGLWPEVKGLASDLHAPGMSKEPVPGQAAGPFGLNDLDFFRVPPRLGHAALTAAAGAGRPGGSRRPPRSTGIRQFPCHARNSAPASATLLRGRHRLSGGKPAVEVVEHRFDVWPQLVGDLVLALEPR